MIACLTVAGICIFTANHTYEIFSIFPGPVAILYKCQDCTLKNEKDGLTQDARLTTGFISFGAGNDKFLLSISADKKEVDYFFALDNSAMCFNDYSRAVITFDTKQKGNFKNGSTRNCKGFFILFFLTSKT